jgi:hypothetical protein
MASPAGLDAVFEDARFGRWPEVNAVLRRRGFDVNARDREGLSLLHWAAGAGLKHHRYFFAPLQLWWEALGAEQQGLLRPRSGCPSPAGCP